MVVSELIAKLGLDPKGFNEGLDRAVGKMEQTGKRMQNVGRNMTMSVTLPLIGIGIAAGKTAADFEASMAKIEGLVGIAGDEVAEMGMKAREMAVAMGKSAAEAGDALFFITSAGLRGKQAMDVLEQSLKASAIGLGDTATVADLATSAMNAYGPAVLSAGMATDVMVAAVREGKLEANELAGSMGRVLPVASAMGVSFNEVGAAFAALSRTGTNAAEAATQIRGILASLLKPTKEADDALAGMGLSAQGLREQIREKGLLSVLDTLATEFEGNEEAAALVFGNIRALSGVMDLMGANTETTRKIFESMNDTLGATDKAFEATADTARFRMNKAIAEGREALLTLGNVINTAFIPIIEKMGRALGQATEWFKGLSEEKQRMIVIAAAAAAAIGPLLFAFGFLIKNAALIVGAIRAISIAMATNPYGAILAALGLLVTVLMPTLIKHKDAILERMQPLISGFKELGGSMQSLIKIFTDLYKEIEPLIGDLLSTLGPLLLDLASITMNVVVVQLKVLATVMGKVAQAIGWVIRQLKSLVGIQEAQQVSAGKTAQATGVMNAAMQMSVMIAGKLAETNKTVTTTTNKQAAAVESLKDRQAELLKQLEAQAEQGQINNATLTAYLDVTEKIDAAQRRLTQAIEEARDPAAGLVKDLKAFAETVQIPLDDTVMENQLRTIMEIEGEIQRVQAALRLLDTESPEFAALKARLESLQEKLNGVKNTAEDVATTFSERFEVAITQAAAAIGQAIGQFIGEVAVDAFERLGAAAGGATDAFVGFGLSLLESVAKLGQQVGSILIGIGTALIALTTANPATIIAAGLALVALSGALKAVLNRQREKQEGGGNVPEFAQGGIVTGPTLAMVGEYPGARSNPEVIAPLSKLEDLIGGMGGNVVFEIRGSSLVGVLDREGKRMYRR